MSKTIMECSYKVVQTVQRLPWAVRCRRAVITARLYSTAEVRKRWSRPSLPKSETTFSPLLTDSGSQRGYADADRLEYRVIGMTGDSHPCPNYLVHYSC